MPACPQPQGNARCNGGHLILQDAGHFGQPTAVAFFPNGDFLISDGYTNRRVAKYDKNGKFLMDWGGVGTGPGQFAADGQVHSVAIDANRKVYVCDRGNNRIEVFDESVAAELKRRAEAFLERRDQELDEKRQALGVEDAVAEAGGFTPAQLVALGEKGVKTLDDLADLASDELIEILGPDSMDEETANAIIMAARQHWFEDEDAAAAAGDEDATAPAGDEEAAGEAATEDATRT